MKHLENSEDQAASAGPRRRNSSRTSEKSATTADVARLAGVSTASVSRVVNGQGPVTADIKSRVEMAIRSLRFVPNASARALRSSKTRLVGAVIPSLNYAIYARMVDGLQKALSHSSISLIIKTSQYDLDAEFDQVRLLVEHGVECVVLVGEARRARTLQLLQEHRVPVVLTYATSSGPEALPSVGFANADAAAHVATHLHELGHRRFAVISGLSHHNEQVQDRVRGFLVALGQLGVPLRDIEVQEVDYRMAAGYEATRALLARGPRATAVFCGSDVIAIGCLRACRELGLECPEDISIVGFDNLEIGEYMSPPLSSVDVPGDLMGAEAAALASRLLNGENRIAGVCMPSPLILRASTAPPRKPG